MSDAFADLPDALVRDLLTTTTDVAEGVSRNLRALAGARQSLRDMAKSDGLVHRKADLDVVREPSVVGIDGSYQIHRLMSMDLCAAAAVAVEGTAKEARRYWPEPRHQMWVNSVAHSRNPTNALRGLMITMEVQLAELAPHDLVLLDGSFVVLLIYMNQGLTSRGYAPPSLWEAFIEKWEASHVLESYVRLLSSDRTVALPKYSGRNELARFLTANNLPYIDGRSLATLLLEPGEYLGPIPIYRFDEEDREYHLPREFCSIDVQERINKLLTDMRVVFFRPFGWAPAIRIELPSPIANNNTRFATVLYGLERQLFTPAVVEPYPLFLADRMVKSLGAGGWWGAVRGEGMRNEECEGRSCPMADARQRMATWRDRFLTGAARIRVRRRHQNAPGESAGGARC